MTIIKDQYRKTYNYLYRITNSINHKIYIGCHQTNNLEDGYMGSGKALKIAQEKYGITNFKKEILEFYDSAELMFDAERLAVNREFIKSDNNYNLAEGGGTGGFKGERCYKSPSRSAKLSASSKNVASAKNKDGKIIRVSCDDPRFDSKELVGSTKGMSVVKDKFDNIFFISKDDPRIKSGELVGITKGLAMVKDNFGNRYQVQKDDPRIKSGELVGITKGSIQTSESNKKRSDAQRGLAKPQKYVKCEYCGKSTSKTNIIRWHKKCMNDC